ncbi:MAG: GTP cyclohydrolase II [Treponema sp.]|nr:GTP cyclohydrolase II [Treponema sp.]MBQ2207957.1 GTP cyclohydrolase II [Treponema sp.]MBQ3980690.1 GTP cyclohydrolase II [Treponema sp.]MBQ5449095.1 GTP cyclohydrolase II [Treponema sp.]MBQ5568921.1 GTP cyclohydrolase II [Treponema sp.]
MEKNMECNPFGSIEQALEDLAAGKMIIVTDDEDRENEGDIIVSCKFASPQTVNFIAKNACGLICMPVSKKVAQKLNFDPMTANNTDNHCTAFTISVDHVSNSTGISAFDRSATAMAVTKDDTLPSDFRRPGHMFPLIAKEHGVLERAGHTEATVDLCRLAGLPEAGLCCEIMSQDGSMARLPELCELAKKWGMTIVSIKQLIAYRKSHEKIIEMVAKSNLPTKYGMFELYGFKDLVTGEHHEALVMGDIADGDPVLCRVHSECLTGDTFGSLKCDCGQQLDLALKKISEEGRGVLVYLTQEGRGIGILNKIKAYALQDKGMDTVDANLALGLPEDARDYNVGIQILRDLGVSKIKLMTNNPKKIYGLGDKNCGLEITERIPLQIQAQKFDSFYLETKMKRMGHLLNNI